MEPRVPGTGSGRMGGVGAAESADAVQAVLAGWQPAPAATDSPPDTTVQKALFLARHLQRRAQQLQTPPERRQQLELERMMQNPGDKVTLLQLTDQAFRSEAVSRSADQLVHILDVQGIPRFFSPVQRALLRGFQSFGSYLPGVAIPLVKSQMRRETANVILPAEPEILREHLQARREERVRMNVNYLGEAILGEREAESRLKQYLAALQLPEIEVMSIKISTIYSQILPIAREHSLHVLCDRLELLYRAAAKSRFQRADGTTVPKFIYLDMEEYRDLALTAEAFMRTLDRTGMKAISAGIALQAYIPDSFTVQQRITDWARRRVDAGGAPVVIRIVKGANMEMERCEASHRGWLQAPFASKIETDANYKRMVRYALRPEHRAAVRPGIASHNLFDLSYALVLSLETGGLADIQFEMLEGMANPQRRALHELGRNLLLYAPACHRDSFIQAIGYLVRRLEENTGEENFLRHAFNLSVDSPAWRTLETGFISAFERIPSLPSSPRRTQNRQTEVWQTDSALPNWTEFRNEPDTDFSLPQNGAWAESIVAAWKSREGAQAVEIPLSVAGEPVVVELAQGTTGPPSRPERSPSGREVRQCLDPSRSGVVVGRYVQANSGDAARAVEFAKRDPGGWSTLGPDQRHRILRDVATELRRCRGHLMGAALAEGGKTLMESDPEVSEAIDFVEFYAATARYFQQLPGITARPRGVVVVVSPWNFPIAIPCGGVAAALAAGNRVILKPASHTVLVAHELCECFWRGGVPRSALQLLPCSGATVGQQLVEHPDVDTVILTGGTDTALQMLDRRPEMRLLAETGGKNATIVTALADRDQAIKHVIHSAFSHAGQKCSATSLLLLQEEVYDDPDFRSAMLDAVTSIDVGSAWDLKNRMGPLIRPPSGDLERGLKELEAGESWALLPQPDEENPCVFTPGIKWDVQPGSFTHCTELFGPVLGVMKFRHLHEAIDLVNRTGYGLTSGLESLDDREQQQWLAGIRAGNLYVNRPTTGAIVLRQPFGGMGKSAFGPGIKAGGPNYVAQLLSFESTGIVPVEGPIEHPDLRELVEALDEARFLDAGPRGSASGRWARDEREQLRRAVCSYDFYARSEFLREHDTFRLIGQDNLRRYRPVEALCIRVHAADSWFEIFARAAAARAVGCRVIISSPHDEAVDPLDYLHRFTESWGAGIEFLEQSDAELIDALQEHEFTRLRFAAPNRVPVEVRRAALRPFVYIADAPVLEQGRVELLWYVQEQSVCIDYHRYGNLGSRSTEQRAPVG